MSLDPKQQAKTQQPSEALMRLQMEHEAAERREVRAWRAGFTVGLCIALSVAVLVNLAHDWVSVNFPTP